MNDLFTQDYGLVDLISCKWCMISAIARIGLPRDGQTTGCHACLLRAMLTTRARHMRQPPGGYFNVHIG
jgi:hypothetical protein